MADPPRPSVTFQVDYYEPEEAGPRAAPNQTVYDVTVTEAEPPLPTQPLKDLGQNPRVFLPRAEAYEKVLNMIFLRNAGQDPSLTTAARGTKIFSLLKDSTRSELAYGLWLYRGYSMRARILQGGLFLCLNTTAAVMYEETWADLLIQKWRAPERPHSDLHYVTQLEKFLKKVKVQGMFGTTHRVKAIVGVAHVDRVLQKASDITFLCDRHPVTGDTLNKKITILAYFRMAYLDFSFRNEPQIVLRVGSSHHSILWPANACKMLPGQAFKKPLSFTEQAQAMIKSACREPSANINLITTEGLGKLGIKPAIPQSKAGTMSTNSPFQVWMEMTSAPARRLKPSTVKFLNGTMSPGEAGKGQWNLRDRKFAKSGEMVPYTILVFKTLNEPPITNLAAFVSRLGTEIAKYCNKPAGSTAPTMLTGIPRTHNYPANYQVA